MQFLLIVLNKVEILDTLLSQLMDNGIHGATILNSTGMIRELSKTSDDFPIFGTLRYLIDPDRKESKTIFMVLKDEQVEEAKNIVRQVVGDIANLILLLCLPCLFCQQEGLGFNAGFIFTSPLYEYGCHAD